MHFPRHAGTKSKRPSHHGRPFHGGKACSCGTQGDEMRSMVWCACTLQPVAVRLPVPVCVSRAWPCTGPHSRHTNAMPLRRAVARTVLSRFLLCARRGEPVPGKDHSACAIPACVRYSHTNTTKRVHRTHAHTERASSCCALPCQVASADDTATGREAGMPCGCGNVGQGHLLLFSPWPFLLGGRMGDDDRRRSKGNKNNRLGGWASLRRGRLQQRRLAGDYDENKQPKVVPTAALHAAFAFWASQPLP